MKLPQSPVYCDYILEEKKKKTRKKLSNTDRSYRNKTIVFVRRKIILDVGQIRRSSAGFSVLALERIKTKKKKIYQKQ